MKKISGIISIVSNIAKYGAIIVAIVKGVEVIVEELKKIDLNENK